MAEINFITSNPALEAFRKAEETARTTETHNLKMRSGLREESEAEQTWDARRRSTNAAADYAQTRAATAKAEAPYAGPMAATRLRQAEASAKHAELQDWYKASELLEAGRDDEAREVARMINKPLPEAVFANSAVRRGIAAINKRAQELYPNRPAQQQAFISSQMQDAQTRMKAGEDATSVWTQKSRGGVYDMPDGAPTPPETSTTFANRFEALPKSRVNPETGKDESGYVPFDRTTGDEGEFRPGHVQKGRGGAGSARKITGTEAIINELRAEAEREGRPISYADALMIAKRSGQSSDSLTLQRERLALSAAKGDTNFLTNPDATLEKYRQRYGLGAPTTSPVPQPAPSPVPDPAKITGVQTQQPPNPSRTGAGVPMNIQAPPLPPGVPQGSGWSPGKRRFYAPDGRVFDENGGPVL